MRYSSKTKYKNIKYVLQFKKKSLKKGFLPYLQLFQEFCLQLFCRNP